MENSTRSDSTDGMRLGERVALALIILAFAGLSVLGSTWGLPSRAIDKYLFPDAEPWPGEKIYRLAGAAEKFSPQRGADVDADARGGSIDEPIPLTATDGDIAKIYLRYRLYTHQPDEMITMMALAGMRPGKLEFDPRLYQYGGLFIYPVGALIKTCGLLGLIDVRADVVHYLNNPEEFGKFYLVARAYSAAWGLLGVYVVLAIGRRLGGTRAGLLGALLFTLMPAVVCMAHEGKPHLPGAVLMLCAVLFAMRYHCLPTADAVEPQPAASPGGNPSLRDSATRTIHASRDWWLMCGCCGAALGMVLSSFPIFVLIPTVTLLRWLRARSISPTTDQTGRDTVAPDRGLPMDRSLSNAAVRCMGGVALAGAIYLVSNPYIIVNAVANRDVLRSNFGNSLAMYDISAVYDGLLRVVELTIEGATLPVLLLGVVALIAALARGRGQVILLAVAAGVFFVQFVLIGAGKPAEYGRFGVFPNTALAIGTACLLTHCIAMVGRAFTLLAISAVVGWGAYCGGAYISNFQTDCSGNNSRTVLAEKLSKMSEGLGVTVLADPAPYGCPPLDFSATNVLLVRTGDVWLKDLPEGRFVLIEPTDRPVSSISSGASPSTPISWANKPFLTTEKPMP